MFCKQIQEPLRKVPFDDLPPVRCSDISLTGNYIRFKVVHEQTNVKNLAHETGKSFYYNEELRKHGITFQNYSYKYPDMANFSNVEIRCRENWDEDFEECSKEKGWLFS